MKLGCVLLTAGQGSRLGNIPKALIKLNGKYLIQRQIESMVDAGIDHIFAVTGHYHEQVKKALNNYPIQIIHNPNLNADQGESVRLGIEALGSNFDLIFMMLVDQPFIGSDELKDIISIHQKNNLDQIILPIVDGKRGNPVAIPGSIMKKIINIPKLSCRQYMNQNPQEIFKYQSSNRNYLIDIDTEEDLQNAKKLFNVNFELPELSQIK